MEVAVTALSAAGPDAIALYKNLLAALKKIGKFEIEVKKTSVHLVRKVAFAGVQLRKQYIVVTIKFDTRMEHPRISRTEQTSRNRWHSEVKIANASAIDAELLGWLRKSYELAA